MPPACLISHRGGRGLLIACMLLVVVYCSPQRMSAGEIESPDVPAMAGQMLMMGFQGTTPEAPAARALARQIKAGHVGGVIMLGYNFESRAGVQGLTRLYPGFDIL